MNPVMASVASVLTVVAIVLPMRSQTFTWARIDGHAVRMFVAGPAGQPEGRSRPDPSLRDRATVVFDSGLATLEMWGKVQPAVSRFAKTVAYDHPGVGLSEAGPLPRDGRRVAAELHRALRAAGVAPPYVLVGASLGGPCVRIFADMYPDEVAGLVLVDPTPDDEQIDRTVTQPEFQSVPETLAQARGSRVPAGIPVFLIDAVSPIEVPFATEATRTVRAKARADIAAESAGYRRWLETIPAGRLVTTDSGHNVAIEEPGVVVETIRQATDYARRRASAASDSGAAAEPTGRIIGTWRR